MKPNKLLSFFPVLIILLAVFMLNMTFAPKISGGIMMTIRILLIALFFAAWRILHRKKETHAESIAFTLMVINLAFFIVSFFTSDLWNLNLKSPKGIALAKISDSFFICLVLIFSFLIAGHKLKDIYLTKGKLTLGLIIGFITFILLGFLAIYNPEQPIGSEFLIKNSVWILLFIFSNAFMEELLFRGIFLKQLTKFLKPVWTIILTSIVFAAAHLQVTYTADVLFFTGIVFILGLIWGFLMYFSRSIIASLLFHAGADLMIIIPIYLSFGVNI